MANKKISDLTALGAAPASNDLVPIVDVSDTTDAASGTNKKMTVTELLASNPDLLPDASTTVQGVVEEATQAEVDAGTAAGAKAQLFVNPEKVRAKKYHDYIADAGANDSYAITVVPAITAYVAGQEFTFKANTANTGAATLNVCGLGAVTIKKNISLDLATGDIIANQIIKVVYDGTNFQLVSKTGSTPTIQVFTANGTYTKPTGLLYAVVEVQGAGGSGAASTGSVAGGGGGAGGYTRKIIAAASIGTTETVTVGAADVGSGNTSFGALLTAGNGTNASTSTAGTGGAATGGDINVVGQDGTGGSTGAPGIYSGSGGSSFLGKGGAGHTSTASTGASADGRPGSKYGGGGGGGVSATDGSPTGAGSSGGAGIVIVTEYY